MALGSQLCELPDAEAIRRLMSKNLRKDALLQGEPRQTSAKERIHISVDNPPVTGWNLESCHGLQGPVGRVQLADTTVVVDQQ